MCVCIISQKVLSAQEFVVLNNTNAFFNILLAPFLIQEYPNLKTGILAVLSFIGIVLIVNPAYLGLGILANPKAQIENYLLMKFFALLTGLGGAAMTIFLRHFASSLHPGQNLFVFSVSVIVVSTLYMSIVEGPVLQDGITTGYYLAGADYIKAIFVAVFAASYQISLSFACRYEKKTSNIAIIFQSQTFFSFVFDYVIFSNQILLVNVIGAILVAGCGVLIVISKEQMKMKALETEIPNQELENMALQAGNQEKNSAVELKQKLLE